MVSGKVSDFRPRSPMLIVCQIGLTTCKAVRIGKRTRRGHLAEVGITDALNFGNDEDIEESEWNKNGCDTAESIVFRAENNCARCSCVHRVRVVLTGTRGAGFEPCRSPLGDLDGEKRLEHPRVNGFYECRHAFHHKRRKQDLHSATESFHLTPTAPPRHPPLVAAPTDTQERSRQ